MNKIESEPSSIFPGLLATKLLKDYRDCAKGITDNLGIELLEHLLACVKLIQPYIESGSAECWASYQTRETDFFKETWTEIKILRGKEILHLLW